MPRPIHDPVVANLAGAAVLTLPVALLSAWIGLLILEAYATAPNCAVQQAYCEPTTPADALLPFGVAALAAAAVVLFVTLAVRRQLRVNRAARSAH